MAFSESFLRELRQEVSRLEHERRTLDARIQALQVLLDDKPTAQPRAASNGKTPITQTFKATVLAVIERNPGIKTPDVTKVIREHGATPGGNTDLHHRVYNEIWRLKRDGIVGEHQGGWVVTKG